jgi:hypothetical protein
MLQRPENDPVDSSKAEVAAIAAGMFVALAATSSRTDAGGAGRREAENCPSHWKSASRGEALR